MSDQAHRALSIVIYEHAGYLQSYAADQSYVADQARARIRCCKAIMADVGRIELQIMISIHHNPGARTRGKKRLAELRKAAMACIRGLIVSAHDDWDSLGFQLWLVARLPSHAIVDALGLDPMSGGNWLG